MEVNYNFVSEDASAELKYRSDVLSYAGKLLQVVNARTVIVGLDNHDRPFVRASSGRLLDPLSALDYEYFRPVALSD